MNGNRTCLSDFELASLAALERGTESQRGSWLDHVAECEYCAERLRVLLEVGQNQEIKPNDEELIRDLRSARPAWQLDMARQAARAREAGSGPTRLRRAMPAILSAAAALAAVTIGAFWYIEARNHRTAPSELLAKAYTKNRFFEWRLPDAGWSDYHAQRGSAGNQKPNELARAQGLLAESERTDAEFLDLRGRAELLDSRTEDALALLQRAAVSQANSPDILADLAAAYALEGDRKGDSSQFARTIEYSTRALEFDQSHRRALFNRALARERLADFHGSLDDWERLLAVETDSNWLIEIRSHRDKLRSIIDRRAALMRSGETLDADLDVRSLEWLADDRGKSEKAGSRIREQYQDSWLADASAEPVDSRPLLAAARAVRAGAPEEMSKLSEAAMSLYRRSNAHAHLMRARLEMLHAMNRMIRLDSCRAAGVRLADELREDSYHWIRVQALLETGACEAERGDMSRAFARRREAIDLAARHRLRGLQLRAIGFDVVERAQVGEFYPVWNENSDALRAAYETGYSEGRIQMFLSNYQTLSEGIGLLAAGAVFMQSAAEASARLGNPVQCAANHSLAGAGLLASGLPRLAENELAEAERGLRVLPESPTKEKYLALLLLDQARLKLAGGHGPDNPPAAIEAILPRLETKRDRSLAETWLGTALIKSGRREEGISHLRTADRLAAEIANSLPPDGWARRVARRASLDASRTLASALVESHRGDEALRIWLSAHDATSVPDLVYLLGSPVAAVWSRHGARLHRIGAGQAELRKGISSLLGLAADPGSAMPIVRNQARSLRRELLEPVAYDLPAEGAVSVLPDLEIGLLPFELLDEESPRRGYVFVAGPSHSKMAPGLAERPLLVTVAGGPARGRLPPLASTASETRELQSLMPGAQVLSGAEATEPRVLAALQEAEIFHFSGHAWSGSETAGLYLWNGFLAGPEISRVHFSRLRLAVLSACETARGQGGAGANGVESLVNVFLGSGAKVVVASRWPIDSESTARFMPAFYRSLVSRHPAIAIREAAAAVAAADVRFNHPYYWAAFQVYE